MMSRRLTLTNGEEFNGLDLWRALFVENMGGSIEMTVNERTFFINFPKCLKDEDLQAHVGQWATLHKQFGDQLPEEHVKRMFQNILPEHVVEQIRKRPDLDTLPKQICWVQSELGRFNDSRLSKWNMSKLVQQLKGAPKNATSVSQVGVEHTSDEPSPPPVPDLANLQANIERMVAAALSKDVKMKDERGRDRGRRTERSPSGSRQGSRGSSGRARNNLPNPKFKGCWCCGSPDHSRGACPKFKAIRAANGGKVPADYEGEYEKSLKPRAKVNVVRASSHAQELPETFMWPLSTAPAIPKSPKPPPTQILNRYNSLDDGSDDEDESEVFKALAQISSNVQLKSERSKPQKSKNRKGMDMARIIAVAKMVSKGEIQLPDIEFDSNEEYECCWALVDSGAGVNCAKRSQFPDAVPVDAPPVLLTTANGTPMENRGAMKVVTRSKEGIVRERVFYDAPVEMPILSVAELSLEGPDGSDTRFRKTNGFIEDNATGDRQHFVKRKGIYFMKIFTAKSSRNQPSDKIPDAGFGRPGAP